MSEGATYEDFIDRIHYSDRYSDDTHEYRHVILPKGLLKLIPQDYFLPDGQVLRLLSDGEWRGIGIQQSIGWVHYETHHPEPHILLFRRELDYQSKYGAAGRREDQPRA